MIFFLMKVFKDSQHADAFVKGHMYANRLAYFTKIKDGEVREDKDEGAIAYRRDGLTVELSATDQATEEVSRVRMSGEKLAAPLVMHPEWFDHINIFCLYAGHIGGNKSSIVLDHISEGIKQLKIPADCNKLGKYAVLITNVSEFMKRVQQAAERQRYRFCSGLVKYYDVEVGMPSMRSEIEAVFYKRKEFEYQKEYRFAIDTGTMGGEAITLHIGRIEDISMRISTSDIDRINRGMRIIPTKSR